MDVNTISKVGMTEGAINNWNQIGPILRHIKENPSEEGRLAIKALIRVSIITALIIFLFCVPLCIYAFTYDYEANFEYPSGATKYVAGRIGLYDDFFWYRVDDERYEVDLNAYANDEVYESGEDIYIYLDDNNQLVGISHGDVMENKMLTNVIIPLLVAIFGTIILELLHALLARKTYGKHWYLYAQWYYKEIAE